MVVELFLKCFSIYNFFEGNRVRLTFHDCLQYRCGEPNDEDFYFGHSRYKYFGVKWGEFYFVHNSNWKKDFPTSIFVSNYPYDKLKHYLFYFKDEIFGCVTKSYDLQIEQNS